MKIAILGAGMAGVALTQLLENDPDVTGIIVIDRSSNALHDIEEIYRNGKVITHHVNIDRETALSAILTEADCIISALPQNHSIRISELALKLNINLLDLGTTDDLFEKQLKLDDRAKKSNTWIIPNCGLAPGLVNILTMHGFNAFDKVEKINIRLGGLPVNPIPPFNYQIGFSPSGLVREYAEPSHILRDGKVTEVESLSELEHITIDYQGKPLAFESFHISGRITSAVKLLEGKVNELDYKTIRYPGHHAIFQGLMALGFGSTQIIDIRSALTYQEFLVRQLKKNLPSGHEDMVLGNIFVEGSKDGKKTKRTYSIQHGFDKEKGISAMMYLTALSTIIVAKLCINGLLKGKGGVSAPEAIVPSDEYLKALQHAGIQVGYTDEVM